MKYTVIFAILFSVTISSFSQRLMRNIKAHDGAAISVDINNDGSRIITGGADKRTYIWDSKTGDKLKTIGTNTGNINGVAFNSGAKLFMTACEDKKVIIWESESGKPKGIIKGAESAVLSADYNKVNDYKACGTDDGKILVWDATNKLITTLDDNAKAIRAVSFSPDGRLLVSVSDDNMIRVWNIESFQLDKSFESGLKGLKSVAFSSDGRLIATGGSNGVVGIWEAMTGKKIGDVSDLTSNINCTVFSPDVQYMIAAGQQNEIVVWDMEMLQVVKRFKAHEKGINSFRINDKGNILAAVGNDGALTIWDISDLKIGKKKAAQDSREPELVCSGLKIKENDENGILENTDNPVLTFSVTNNGNGPAYDVITSVSVNNEIEGLLFDKEYYIGNLNAGKTQKVEIPVFVSPEIDAKSGIFSIQIMEANDHNTEPQTISFQTKGSNNSFIMVADYKYSSATGKAEIGSPITMELILKNATNAVAKNIKISYRLPENVVAVDKIYENIEEFQPNEIKKVSVQFYANEGFAESELKIGVDIQGAAYNNLDDIALAVKMQEELPVNTNVFIAESGSPDQPVFRGGGDPLKGLNTSAAKREMRFGKYYALIIGIDKYSGDWAKLSNAVHDAKAVEALLKEKYKFDNFRSLYDQEATREKIIQEIEWLVSNVREEDNVFIYYSGHGDYKQELNKGYWVPVDATSLSSTAKYISNSDIQTFLGGIKSKHTLLISDACFSGDIFRGKTVSVPFENSEKYFQKVNELSSRQAISSGGIEPVMDGGRDGHSVFAYYLLKTLTNNSYKYFDASQLFEKIKVPVVNNSEQAPHFSPIKNTGDEGGQFIFITK